MAFQSVPGTASVEIRYLLPGSVQAESILYYKMTGYDQADIDLLAETVDTWVGDEWLGFLNANTTYVEVKVRGLDSSVDFEGLSGAETGAGTGTDAGDPNETSFAITKKTGLIGRSARGRLFMPPPPLGYKADNNHVISGYPTAVATALGDLDVILDGIGWTPVVVSRYTAGAKRTTAVTYPITSYGSSDLTLDSQRGRKPA